MLVLGFSFSLYSLYLYYSQVNEFRPADLKYSLAMLGIALIPWLGVFVILVYAYLGKQLSVPTIWKLALATLVAWMPMPFRLVGIVAVLIYSLYL